MKSYSVPNKATVVKWLEDQKDLDNRICRSFTAKSPDEILYASIIGWVAGQTDVAIRFEEAFRIPISFIAHEVGIEI